MSDEPQPPGRPRSRDDDPVLPTRSPDDSDVGWGDSTRDAGERDEDWYRRERPPHHGD